MIKIAVLMLYTGLGLAQHLSPAPGIKWQIAAQMPAASGTTPSLGEAGVFAGISNNVMLIAGGSNFPGLKPWEGGKKVQINQILLLQKYGRGGYKVTRLKQVLSEKTAYGASTSTPYGIVCAGGETPGHTGTTSAFIMKWDTRLKKVTFDRLPKLPLPLANACIATIGNIVYLFGGESEGQPSAKAFMLNLSTRSGWHAISNVPVAMSHSVAVAQNNGKNTCIYLIGGRSATATGISALHGTTFCYDPTFNKWTKCADVKDSSGIINISAGVGVAYSKNFIYYIGGDKGNIFQKIETYNNRIASAQDEHQKTLLQAEKLKLLTGHQGFSKDVLLYNTLTNAWKKVDELSYLPHVTTTAVMWGEKIFVPGGEIKPGTRTPDIVAGTFEHQNH